MSLNGQKIGVGIIGLGGMAYTHELAIKQLRAIAQVVAVCDTIEEKVHSRVERDGLKGYSHYLDLLRDPEVDSVLITVPHVSNPEQGDPHYVITQASLLNHKHVLVEKPMALKASRARELIDLARDEGLKYTTAENTRFVPSYIEAANKLHMGRWANLASSGHLFQAARWPG